VHEDGTGDTKTRLVAGPAVCDGVKRPVIQRKYKAPKLVP